MSSQFASEGLPRAVVERVNAEFYRGTPHHYFEQRLVWLLHAADRQDETVELPDGTILDDALGRESEFDPDALSGTARGLYVAAEAQVLLHQLGEAVIRLVFGHLGDPPSPRVEMAALSSPAAFKARAENEIRGTHTDRLREVLRPVVVGTAEPSPDGWTEQLLDDSTAVVRELARRLLRDAPLYNAAKHGFAVTAGYLRVEVALDDEGLDEEQRDAAREFEESFRFEGVALQCLEWEKRDNGDRKWFRSDRFIAVADDLALAYLAVRVLANLWSVAKTRYSGGGHAELIPLDGLTPAAVQKNTGSNAGHLRVPILAVPLPDDRAQEVLGRLADRQDGRSDGQPS